MAFFFDSSVRFLRRAARAAFLPVLVSALLSGCAARFSPEEIASFETVTVAPVAVVAQGDGLSGAPPQIAETLAEALRAALAAKGYTVLVPIAGQHITPEQRAAFTAKGYIVVEDASKADFVVGAVFHGEPPPRGGDTPGASAPRTPPETSTLHVAFLRGRDGSIHHQSIDTHSPLGAVTVQQAKDLAATALADLPARVPKTVR